MTPAEQEGYIEWSEKEPEDYIIEELRIQRDEMLAVLQELAESAHYWSEYDVPLGIVDRINDVIRKATT